MDIQDADFMRGQRVKYLWQPVVWEPVRHEDAIVLGRTARRVRILHLNASDAGDCTRLVKPASLYDST